MSAHETRLRSIVKTLTWRFTASLATFLLVYFIFGQWDKALGVAAVEVVLKLILYYGHERIWNIINWGWLTDQPQSMPRGSVERSLSG